MKRPAALLIPIGLLAVVVAALGVAIATTTLVPVSGDILLQSASGPEVVVAGDTDLDTATPFDDSTTVNVTSSDGDAIITSPDRTSLTLPVSSLSGGELLLQDIDASIATLTVDADGLPAVDIDGTAASVGVERGYHVNDGAADLSVDGDVSVTLQDLPASTDIAAVNQSGTIVDLATSDSTGAATFALAGDHELSLLTSGGTPQLSTASPTGPQSEFPANLSVDITDADFGTLLGDVTVEIALNGDTITTETITSAQTVTADLSNQQLPAGNNTWTVTATDAYGQTTTESYQFSVPDELRIYNESNPIELVDNSTVELQFYFDGGSEADLVETRSATDGVVNMTGLPVGESFVVVADADGFVPRRIFVPSLTQEQEVYLLPTGADRVDTIFEIQDYSGDFGAGNTVLLVQRELGSGGFTTVLGDFFGANSDFPAQLERDVRHRLVLFNVETGERRILGTYTPITSETETVTVSPEGDFEIIGRGPTVSVSPELSQLPPRSGINVSAGVLPGDDALESWSADFVAINTTTGNETTLATISNTTPGSLGQSLDLSGRDGERLEVRVSWTTSEAAGSRTIGYRIEQSPAAGDSLLDALGAFGALISAGERAGVLAFVAMATTVIGTAALASAYRIPTELLGLVALLFLLAFAILGWTGYDLVLLAAVALAAITFLRRRY